MAKPGEVEIWECFIAAPGQWFPHVGELVTKKRAIICRTAEGDLFFVGYHYAITAERHNLDNPNFIWEPIEQLPKNCEYVGLYPTPKKLRQEQAK